ncbi:hypothetical protein N0V86_006525 [Didymella sp. IMI 355093]|nr:hypothetical protein N0V86_006525 [Didymella sp. IMI 355093]
MFNFQKYMSIERRVMYLLETRLEDLQEGRSEQSEAAIAEEIKTIEDAIEVRSNAQRDYYDLVRDFLDWAVAHTVLEFQDMILGGPKPTRPNALTNEISLTIVEDLIEDDEEPELLERYERLRILERTFFPARFKRKMLLRMKGYPKVIHEYTPEPLPPFKLNNSVTARVRYNSRTGTVINVIKMYWKVLRQLSSRASTQWVELTHIKDSRDRNDNNVSEDDNKGTTSPVIANSSETDPFEDYEDMLDVDDFKHPEDQSFLTTLRRPDPAVRVAHPALSIQDPDVRVIDFAFPANTNRAGHINLARLIKRIEDINDPHAKKPSPVVCEEPVWWSSNAAQENSKKRCATASQLSPTVSGIEDPDIEAGLTEEVPEDEVGLFQRPIRRLEDRIGNQSKIDATEARGSDSENDTSYEAPGQAESEVLGKILTNEARYHSELDDEAANTEARSIVAEDEPVNTRTAVVRWSAQSTAGGSSGASSKQSSRDH